MSFAAAFAKLERIDDQARTCVRWNPRRRRYELVRDGRVLASVSRLGMSMAGTAARFNEKCRAVLEEVQLAARPEEPRG